MTHATKAIYRWLLSDFIKVSNIATEQMLYSEQDLETSMEKIETINFHEEKEVNGIKFWAYNAGHVLGAAMFMIEVGALIDVQRSATQKRVTQLGISLSSVSVQVHLFIAFVMCSRGYQGI